MQRMNTVNFHQGSESSQIHFEEGENMCLQLKTMVRYLGHATPDIIIMPFNHASYHVKHPWEAP